MSFGFESYSEEFLQQSSSILDFISQSPGPLESTRTVPKLFRNIVMCILSECMHELAILRSINSQNDLGPNANELIKYVSIADRYVGHENHSEYRIGSTDSNFDKLAKDINMLYVAMAATCKEMAQSGSRRAMSETVRIVRQTHADEEQLLADEVNLERTLQELQRQLEAERLSSLRTIDDTNTKIQKLKFEVEDFYIYGKTEVEFFDRWEMARQEQNTIRNAQREGHFQAIIDACKEKTEKENRCHGELVKYFEETRNDCMDQIQVWMKKYDDEVDQYDSDITQVKGDLERTKERMEEDSARYAIRQKEIDEWVEYRTAKGVRDAQEKLEKDSAVIVQCWWRRVMYLKKLGQYRMKKKKKAKKGDDKKKKK